MAQRNQIADRYRKHMQRVHTAAGATSVAAAAASTSAASASVPAAGDGAESEIAETLTPKLTSTAHPTKSRREPLALEDWQHRRSQHRQGKHRDRRQTQEHLDDIKDHQQEQQTLPVVAGFALALPPQETRAVAENRIETEGDRRLRKRNAAIKAIKEKEAYRLYLQGDFAFDAVIEDVPEPVTPDPAASTSKRDWECQIMKWRTTLKVATGVISLQELKYERLNNLRS